MLWDIVFNWESLKVQWDNLKESKMWDIIDNTKGCVVKWHNSALLLVLFEVKINMQGYRAACIVFLGFCCLFVSFKMQISLALPIPAEIALN